MYKQAEQHACNAEEHLLGTFHVGTLNYIPFLMRTHIWQTTFTMWHWNHENPMY